MGYVYKRGSQRRNADMREIIFRGRHKSGDWLYGDLLMQYEPHDPQIYAKQPGYGGYFDVDRETVGQFTELCDLNGQRIFDGDLVRYTEHFGIDEVFEVAYSVESARYALCNPLSCVDDFDNISGQDLIVVGNIHDNPELLGEWT
jgi:hypothetical protein